MSNDSELIRAAVHQAERHKDNGPLGLLLKNPKLTENERNEIRSLMHWGLAMADILQRANPHLFEKGS